MYILEYRIGYSQIQQHSIQQHKGKSFKCIIFHATGTQQPLGPALGRHVTLKYEAVMYLCVYNLCFRFEEAEKLCKYFNKFVNTLKQQRKQESPEDKYPCLDPDDE